MGTNVAGKPLVHRLTPASRQAPSVLFVAVVEAFVLRLLRVTRAGQPGATGSSRTSEMKREISIRPLLCAGLIVALLSVTSCAADDAPTEGARATAGPKAATTATQPSVSPRDPGAIIITIDDLPSSWREAPEPEDEEGGSGGGCLNAVTESVSGLPATGDAAVASFAQSDLGPLLLAMVATPVDDVETSFDALVDRMAACDGTTDDAGNTTVAEPSTLPTIGDETFAIRATETGRNGSRVSYLLAVARVNDTIVLALHILTLGKIDAALVEDVVRTMVRRA